MAIIKKTLKYGTALGITYLSYEQRLWSQLSHQEIDRKLAVVSKYEKQLQTLVTKKTGLDASKWLANAPESMNVKNCWNQTIKTTFKTLSQLDLNELIGKLTKLVNNSIK